MIYLAYLLEFQILVPAAVLVYLPVMKHLRYPSKRVVMATALLVILVITVGVIVCAAFGLSTNVFMPVLGLLFVHYYITVELPMNKRIFCFTNGTMLISFCTAYTSVLTARLEEGPPRLAVFMPITSITDVLLALLLMTLFWKTLSVRLPELLDNPNLDATWNILQSIPVIMTFFMFLIRPNDYSILLQDRMQIILLMLMAVIPVAVYFMYFTLYWIVRRTEETNRLSKENFLLRLDEHRRTELNALVDDARAMRHDIRKHLLVIDGLARRKDIDGIQNYLTPWIQRIDSTSLSYCANHTVDAVASYYDGVAQTRHIKAEWNLHLPADLPMYEADLCGILSNLVENAIHAVQDSPEPYRWFSARASLVSEGMLAVTVKNPYLNPIVFGTNGLPATDEAGHGVGMVSVKSTVTRYDGVLKFQTDEGIFTVQVLLPLNNSPTAKKN